MVRRTTKSELREENTELRERREKKGAEEEEMDTVD